MDDQPQDKKTLRQRLQQAIEDVKELGGWPAIKSGEWLLPLVQKSLRTYYENTNVGYFREKYPRASDDEIVAILTKVAAKNAAILGAITGASVSANEISLIVTGAATGGLSLPAQATIAGLTLAGEAVLLIRLQLQLIANIARIIGAPLDPNDPEDVLLIFGFAVGGVGAELAGTTGARIAGHLAKTTIRHQISGRTLVALKVFARALGLKVLQRTILKYAVPLVSMLVGGGWNYATTQKIGKIAAEHLRKLSEKRTRPRSTRVRRKKPATSRRKKSPAAEIASATPAAPPRSQSKSKRLKRKPAPRKRRPEQ